MIIVMKPTQIKHGERSALDIGRSGCPAAVGGKALWRQPLTTGALV